jgi:hypothetical protein
MNANEHELEDLSGGLETTSYREIDNAREKSLKRDEPGFPYKPSWLKGSLARLGISEKSAPRKARDFKSECAD